MKKAVLLAVILMLLIIPVSASDSEAELHLYTAEEFGAESVLDELPNEVRAELPTEDIYSEDAITESFGAVFFLRFILKAVSAALSPALKTLSALLGILFAASVFARLREMFTSGGVSGVFDIASGLCLMLTVYGSVISLAESVKEYLTRLTSLVGAFVPVTAAISITGGNIGTAAVSTNGMMLGISVVQVISTQILFPIIQLCMGLCAASGMGAGLKLGEISKTVRGAAAFIFSVIGAVISAVMTFQTSIASRADSLSMRTVKFAVSHSVPVVGSVAGDAVGAVAESLSLVKSCVGFGGVILLLLMTVPIVVRILLVRLGFVVSYTVADILGLEREKSIIAEMSGLLGFMAAVCVIAAIMFTYAAALFATTAAATA